MNRLTLLIRAVTALSLTLALNACAAPYGGAVATRGVGMGAPGMMGGGMPMGSMPFGNVGWQHEGSGFDPAMQPMIAAQQAMNTVYAVSPNITVTHPMPQPSPTTTVGTASQAAPADGYATQAQLRAVAGRVHRNAVETARDIDALRRQRR
jgi:hypothetical protein